MAGFNANFRNEATDKDYTMRADPGRQTASGLIVLPPERGLNSIDCGEIVEDSLTTSTFKSLFRFMDDLVACQRYYSVLFSFRIDDAGDVPNATVYVRSSSFAPFVRVWRNATHVFDIDAEQSSAGELVIPIQITDDITGPFIIEVTSELPYQTGDFEVELQCNEPGGIGVATGFYNFGYRPTETIWNGGLGTPPDETLAFTDLEFSFSGDPTVYTYAVVSGDLGGLSLSVDLLIWIHCLTHQKMVGMIQCITMTGENINDMVVG
jgi:hypothetical protein